MILYICLYIYIYIYQNKLFSISVIAQDLKRSRDIQLCLFLSVSRVQMQRFASVSDSVTVQRQALTK